MVKLENKNLYGRSKNNMYKMKQVQWLQGCSSDEKLLGIENYCAIFLNNAGYSNCCFVKYGSVHFWMISAL